MDEVEITIAIELEDGVHEARIISSQTAVDAIVAALEGDATGVESVEVAEPEAEEEPEAEDEGEAA